MSMALHSELLDQSGITHAFFSRQGGVSRPPYDTLNFSTGTGDDEAAVRENLQRAAAHLGVAPGRIYFLKQVHGRAHYLIGGDEPAAELAQRPGDITVTRNPEVAAAVRTADCPAVLMADRKSGTVAAVHSGWRGTVQRVVQAALTALDSLGCQPVNVVAAIGPHIEACCFEVGPDVAAELAGACTLGPAVVDESRAKPHVDLRRILEAQLREGGVPAANIDHVRGCTLCEPESFHSYRRDGSRGGRMLAAIVPPDEDAPAP